MFKVHLFRNHLFDLDWRSGQSRKGRHTFRKQLAVSSAPRPGTLRLGSLWKGWEVRSYSENHGGSDSFQLLFKSEGQTGKSHQLIPLNSSKGFLPSKLNLFSCFSSSVPTFFISATGSEVSFVLFMF